MNIAIGYTCKNDEGDEVDVQIILEENIPAYVSIGLLNSDKEMRMNLSASEFRGVLSGLADFYARNSSMLNEKRTA
ncbi:MAG: hypothetical protein AAGU11_17170 [Syntrophobacteraceae bacterium]